MPSSRNTLARDSLTEKEIHSATYKKNRLRRNPHENETWLCKSSITRDCSGSEHPWRQNSGHDTQSVWICIEQVHWWSVSLIFCYTSCPSARRWLHVASALLEYALPVQLGKACMVASSGFPKTSLPCWTWRFYILFVRSLAASKTALDNYGFPLLTQSGVRRINLQIPVAVRRWPEQESCLRLLLKKGGHSVDVKTESDTGLLAAVDFHSDTSW